jgi:hypothetical protein
MSADEGYDVGTGLIGGMSDLYLATSSSLPVRGSESKIPGSASLRSDVPGRLGPGREGRCARGEGHGLSVCRRVCGSERPGLPTGGAVRCAWLRLHRLPRLLPIHSYPHIPNRILLYITPCSTMVFALATRSALRSAARPAASMAARPAVMPAAMTLGRRGYAEAVSDKLKLSFILPHAVSGPRRLWWTGGFLVRC